MLPSNSHKSKTPSYVLYMTMVPKVDKMQYWEKFYGKFNLSKPTGHMMQQQFNVQQLYSAHTVFMCFVFIWEQTPTCATYSIKWLVFITEMKSVYCAVRTGSLTKTVCASYLKGKYCAIIGGIINNVSGNITFTWRRKERKFPQNGVCQMHLELLTVSDRGLI